MTRKYTINQFLRKDFLNASYNCILVKEYDQYNSDDLMELLKTCVVLAHDWLGNKTNYNIRFRRMSEDEREIFAGAYPGIELTRKNETSYETAWLIVPVLDENGN